MTWLRIHRQLEAARKRAERAVSLARAGREAIEASIDRLHQQIEVLRGGCIDFDLEDVLFENELRMLLILRELERFEREVSQPAEELHRRTLANAQAFEESLARNRARTSASRKPDEMSVRFSDSSGIGRTPPPTVQ